MHMSHFHHIVNQSRENTGIETLQGANDRLQGANGRLCRGPNDRLQGVNQKTAGGK